MAIKIAALSQKGGVGKSTLCRALAVEYARNEWEVKVADMDVKQSTSATWSRERTARGSTPSLAVEVFTSVSDVLKQDSDYDLLIFDGAGHADLQTLEIAKVSDYIILPSGLSKDDLIPQIKLANELVKNGISNKKIGIALMRVGKSKSELKEVIEYIGQTNYQYLGHLKEKTSISRNHDKGLAANETRYASINKLVDDLIQSIVDRIETFI